MIPTHRVSWNVSSLFAKPTADSEQVSQLIWGAPLEVNDSESAFSRVTGEDRYSGWIRSAQIVELEDDSDLAVTTIAVQFAEVYQSPHIHSLIRTRLTLGSRIVLSPMPIVDGFVPVKLSAQDLGYIHESQISLTFSSDSSNFNPFVQQIPDREMLLNRVLDQVAHSSIYFAGVPYLWGGTTPFGMDCSGFTQLVYKINGIQLLRDSSQQWEDRRFEQIPGLNGLESEKIFRSDLVFFGRESSGTLRITHVGIALGDGRFVHSVGNGRGNIISPCNDPEFTATFVGCRRLAAGLDLSIDAA